MSLIVPSSSGTLGTISNFISGGGFRVELIEIETNSLFLCSDKIIIEL